MNAQQQATAAVVIAGAAFALGAFVMYSRIKSRYKKLPWWKRFFIRMVT